MAKPSLDAQRETAARLAKDLATLDFVLHGSIIRRLVTCNTPNCRCHAAPENRHGPYWDWTRKVRGKTVTVRLSPAQAQRLEPWIQNARRADRILGRMERVTLRVVNRILKEVEAEP